MLNRRTDAIAADAVYVGRPSKWGNPFKIGSDGDRAEVIGRYRTWVLDRIRAGRLDIVELEGRSLVCWCAPQPCHADELLEVAADSASNRR